MITPHSDGTPPLVVEVRDSTLVTPGAFIDESSSLPLLVVVTLLEHLAGVGTVTAGGHLVAGEVFVLGTAWVVEGSIGGEAERSSRATRWCIERRGGGRRGRFGRDVCGFFLLFFLYGRVGSGRVERTDAGTPRGRTLGQTLLSQRDIFLFFLLMSF